MNNHILLVQHCNLRTAENGLSVIQNTVNNACAVMGNFDAVIVAAGGLIPRDVEISVQETNLIPWEFVPTSNFIHALGGMRYPINMEDLVTLWPCGAELNPNLRIARDLESVAIPHKNIYMGPVFEVLFALSRCEIHRSKNVLDFFYPEYRLDSSEVTLEKTGFGY